MYAIRSYYDAVRSAAYTGSLTTYLANFQQRIPTLLEAQYMKDIKSVIDTRCDAEILNWLRDETTYMVMLVRLQNQDRKEAYEQAQSDIDEGWNVDDDPGSGDLPKSES